MSKSLLIKIVFAAAFLLPVSTHAAELNFGEKKWTVEPEYSNQTTLIPVRNDFPVKNLVTESLTGKQVEQKTNLLSEATAEVINNIASEINQPTKSAKLVVEDGWAKDFEPGQSGQALDVYELRKLISSKPAQVDLPVMISFPQNKLSDTNGMGINELVATGESDFSGSTRARIHNIEVGRSRFDGLIIKPGEEFSFNKYLGEVDGEHGFLPELVIKQDGVRPEFGGGLCQVSSTSFRAAMNAGLNITARRNHSFAVHYYAPQGSDATIYPGVQDFKFVNDTPNHLLVWTRMDLANKKLYFDYYGTKDSRVVELDGPYQYDKKSNGAMKATWTKKVTLNGQTTEQVFNSVYRPPAQFQAAPQASTPNPEAAQTPNNTTETPTEAPTPNPAPPTT